VPASLESSIADLADIMQALGAARTSVKKEKKIGQSSGRAYVHIHIYT
jgi:hypothetical protein